MYGREGSNKKRVCLMGRSVCPNSGAALLWLSVTAWQKETESLSGDFTPQEAHSFKCYVHTHHLTDIKTSSGIAFAPITLSNLERGGKKCIGLYSMLYLREESYHKNKHLKDSTYFMITDHLTYNHLKII